MNLHPQQPSALWWFIPLSIALHLLLLLLVPKAGLLPQPSRDEPIVVEVRPPAPQPPRSRELDVPLQPEAKKPRETPARRLGPQDLEVQKETAPTGQDTDDMRPSAVAPPPQPPRPKPKTERPKTAEPPPRPVVARPAEKAPAPATEREPQESPTEAAPAKPLPALESLLQLPQTTESRIESQLRQKYRKDVEEGDAVWLDMEKDILISFFQRFRTNIYGVWNYPRKAAERGEEGTCLLRVTVRRNGSVESVKLMESSGSATLDQEAIRAVWKGAPYGPLPRAYEEEKLSIFAFFQYRLGSRPFMSGGS